MRQDPTVTSLLAKSASGREIAPTGRAAFTVREFCGLVGLGRTRFYEEVRAGRISVLKSGARTLIRAAEVESFLDRLEDEPPVGPHHAPSTE